ncbi:uncharacterized protein LOC118645174 [Monomorium pharaonis]|uniref:uncharacterized protein LOC118645174 n=1 Tax=Monomorium pharaonis TaxID=307658 RepID=UPI001746103C|nr:uncharacterized protein LOC118645174 [Monomorium pharaonis]
MTTLEDIIKLEEYLEKEKNILNLGSYLSTIGGRGDITSITNKILRRLLSDTIASSYSFFGKRNNKKSFANLKLNNVVITSVQKALPNTTQHEVEDSIKVWLKHAPQRFSIKANKSK